MKPLALFDLDGTFFRWQLYHELVFEFKNQGVFATETAEKLDTALIEWQAKRRSWRDYEHEVIHALEPRIKDMSIELLESTARNVVSRSGHKVYNYTKNLLDSLKKDGYHVLAISGSQQEIAQIFAEQYGFDNCLGALYERTGDHFSGGIIRRVPGRKHEIIQEYLHEHPTLTLTKSVAVGDSEGDISMLELVDQPIAFNPSSGLLEIAKERGWDIVIERKNIAYTLRKDSHGSFLLEETDIF